jgi:hypothetical protein
MKKSAFLAASRQKNERQEKVIIVFVGDGTKTRRIYKKMLRPGFEPGISDSKGRYA